MTIIIIIIAIPVTIYTHGMYSYTRQTNPVYTVYCVAAVLYVQSVLHVMLFGPCNMLLYLYISTSRSLCAVHNMAVVCSSLTSPFAGMLLWYCLK